jgi:phytanoyl-CoA hydroxylase
MAMIKRIKLLYAVYNFFHKKQLAHNIPLLKKAGIRKKYFSSLSSKDFEDLPGSNAKNFSVNKQTLTGIELFNKLAAPDKESLLNFSENGYAIISKYFTDKQVDNVNDEIALLLKQKKIKINYGNKIMFAIHQSQLLSAIGNNKELKELLSVLMNGNAVLFQSINFLMGSEQDTHSDSIHMTTYPLGGLLGVWIALEDITEDNGPLHYYPKSHLLPYYLNADYNNEGNAFLLGDKSYNEYEKMIENKIAAQIPGKIKFLAKKGDLLIWHANLFHGGEPHTDKTKTRKSMVLHYFNEDAVCYHEITQRPALIKKGLQ